MVGFIEHLVAALKLALAALDARLQRGGPRW